MTWDDGLGTIVTGAIGLGIGIVVAGKLIKDVGSIKSQDHNEDSSKLNPKWRL